MTDSSSHESRKNAASARAGSKAADPDHGRPLRQTMAKRGGYSGTELAEEMGPPATSRSPIVAYYLQKTQQLAPRNS